MSDYSAEQIEKNLRNLGLKKNDIVFCHSNIGYFGRLKGIRNKNSLCKIFFQKIFKIIGKRGTLIVPTFTYSFFKKENFTVNSVSNMGIFSEWVRLNKKGKRSMDPNFSVYVVGKYSNYFSEIVENKTHSHNSFFGKFHKMNGKILNFNHPGATILHYYEKILNVDYRFEKKFKGMLNNSISEWYVLSRYLGSNHNIHYPFKLVNLLRRKKKEHFSFLGKGEIFLMSSKLFFSFVKKEYKSNRNLLIKKN